MLCCVFSLYSCTVKEIERGSERERERAKERKRERQKTEKERERERKREIREIREIMRKKEKEREKDRQTERQTEKKRHREARHWRGVDVVATNVTTATVSKQGVTSSRPAFEAREGQKERERN